MKTRGAVKSNFELLKSSWPTVFRTQTYRVDRSILSRFPLSISESRSHQLGSVLAAAYSNLFEMPLPLFRDAAGCYDLKRIKSIFSFCGPYFVPGFHKIAYDIPISTGDFFLFL